MTHPAPEPAPTVAPSAPMRASKERAFADYLVGLARDDRRAALAALRRGLGKQPGEVAEMFPYVVPWLGADTPPQRQADYFLVASLFATHQITWPSGSQGYTNLGASFRTLANTAGNDSIERRFVALLNTAREDLPQQLRHATSLLRAHDIPVDWARLLIDLAYWDRDSHPVQLAWAQAFWRYDASASTANADSEATAASDK